MLKRLISILLVIFMMIYATGCSSTDSVTEEISDMITENKSARVEETGAAIIEYAKDFEVDELVGGNVFYVTSEESQEEIFLEDNLNRESYKEIIENNFIMTDIENTSTFSIDVDTASYSNVRNILSYGDLPNPDAVRIEEMINYFDYDYETPDDGTPLNIHTKITECPWEPEDYVTMIGIKGEELDRDSLPPSNIVMLIDVSGSMNDENKLPLLKDSFETLVDSLSEKDRVSMVVYAGASGVVLEGAEGSDKNEIMEALDHLQAGGSTAGSEGIELAYKMAKKYFIENGNNRVILATDGDFNVGISDVNELEDFIEEKRNDGIFLSVIGFGRGNTRDDIMETLADKGNGNYAYIDSLTEANKVFSEEFIGTLFTIAKDVKIQIEFNSNLVESYRLIGYENRMLENEDFEDDTKDAGEIGAGHEVTALYQIVAKDDIDLSEVSEDIYTVKLRYKEPDEDISKEVVNDKVEYVSDLTKDYDFGFALGVAEFGLLLRNSEYQGDVSIEFIEEMTKNSLQNKRDDYKEGFLDVVSDYEEVLEHMPPEIIPYEGD